MKWKSSDATVAKVDNTGLVSAMTKGGTAIITATARDGSGVYGTCTVTVVQPVTGVTDTTTDEEKAKTLSQVGDTIQLAAKVQPDDATNQTIVWSTSDGSVATVSDSGLVTATGTGYVQIKAASEDGEYCVTYSYYAGEISAEGNAAKVGDTEYATLAEAVAAATNGETITLLKDINVPDDVITLGGCSLDLDGHTLIAKGLDVPVGVTVDSITNGTLVLDRGNTASLAVYGTVNEISDCVIDCTVNGCVKIQMWRGESNTNGYTYDSSQAYTGSVALMENCTVTGDLHVCGELVKASGCTISGNIEAQGANKVTYVIDGEDVPIPAQYATIGGIYDCTAQDVVSEYGEITIYSGTYNTAKYSKNSNTTMIYGGRYKSLETSKLVQIADGYKLSDTADEDGYYPIVEDDTAYRVTLTVDPADASVLVYQADDADKTPLSPLTE